MITGELFIGFGRVKTPDAFQAAAAASGALLSPPFSIAGAAEVARACALAAAAFDPYRKLDFEARAHFLDAIADEILSLGDEPLERAHLETGLSLARLGGERGLANTVEEVAHVVRG